VIGVGGDVARGLLGRGLLGFAWIGVVTAHTALRGLCWVVPRPRGRSTRSRCLRGRSGPCKRIYLVS
jgi:hypothetical protein